MRINGTTPDLQITLSTGTSYQISLKGAQTVQDVINDIETATGGTVSVVIDPTSQQALDVSQVYPAVVSSAPSTLTVAAINGSYAAADLGIAGSDVEGVGMITGQSLSGDSLQKHFFIENTTLQASVIGTVSQASATGDLGAVAMVMANGSGSIQVQGSLTLKNATTFDQLAQALQGSTSLSSLVSPQVSGNAQLTLPLQLYVPPSSPAGITLPSGAKVVVNWTNVTDPTTLTVTVTPALGLLEPDHPARATRASERRDVRSESGCVALEPAAPRAGNQPHQGRQSRIAARRSREQPDPQRTRDDRPARQPANHVARRTGDRVVHQQRAADQPGLQLLGHAKRQPGLQPEQLEPEPGQHRRRHRLGATRA